MSYERLEHAGGALSTKLVAGITSGDTTVTILDTTGWPTGAVGPFYFEIDPGTASAEKILATDLTGQVLSGLTRGADGTTAVAHDADAVAIHGFAATEADEANYAVTQTVGQITGQGQILVSSAANQFVVLPKGTTGYPLLAGSATLTFSQLGTAGIAAGAVNGAQMTSDRRVVYAASHTGAGSKLCSDNTFTDYGASQSVTVPLWATGAIVTTRWSNLNLIGGGTALGMLLRTVLGTSNGTSVGLVSSAAASSSTLPHVSYVDTFTGLGPGDTITLKTQAEGDGTSHSGAGLNWTPAFGTSGVSFDVEYVA